MSGGSADSVEPNLTPMLDMVFQLVTFFMLVINFKGASMDLSLKLPVLGSAKPVEWHGKKEPLVLNLKEDGSVSAFGSPIPDVEKFVVRETRVMREYLKSEGATNLDEMPIPVIVRADGRAPFAQVNKVIKLCQSNGFRQFQLSAMSAAENKGP